MIPLSSVISSKVVENAPLISHYNLFRSTEINGGAAPGYSSGQAIEALRQVAANVLPAGYGYEFSGLSREEINAGRQHNGYFCFVYYFCLLVSHSAVRKLVGAVFGTLCRSYRRIRRYSYALLFYRV